MVRDRFWAAFDDWVRGLDSGLRKSTMTIGAFAGLTLVSVTVMAALAYAPLIRDFFQFDFWGGVLLFLPQLALGAVLIRIEALGKLTSRRFGVITLAGAFLFQCYMWAMVPLSSGPGAMAMSAFPLLLTSFHGYLYGATLKEPFSFVISVLALGFSFTLAKSTDHYAILSVVGGAALGSHLVLGYVAKGGRTVRRQAEALRAAVDAQVLDDNVAELRQTERLLVELRGRAHDAGNAVTGPLLNMPHLLRLLEGPLTDSAERKEVTLVARAIAGSLERLRDLLGESRRSIRAAVEEANFVCVADVAAQVALECGDLHPAVLVTLQVAPEAEAVLVPLQGGAGSLHRILTNLVVNALEGDGRVKPSRVTIEVDQPGTSAHLRVAVEDDGGGFPAHLLSGPVQALRTTKPTGTGLGLYTVSRLVAASRGRLERSNVTPHGARVTLLLRRDEEP
jgi:two-component system, NtrC family, C4-dicarboxylate transport sensor histidine kinase DctB